ncbi:MAG: nucleotidyl transferase AbiEii/AbiGii toxin family protein [Elusimicrobia bacterium]|nr:nucleotidyl transferase AbiEii/AbiGii toxin family protein [Elusimicrobiota bacterium]
MISRSQITELSSSWQTPEPNVAREFVQHVLLSALFRIKGAEAKLAFKGGTALRLLHRSPRFSEDLDFTAWIRPFHVGEWIKETAKEAGRAGLDFKMLESNPTSGGWFALMETHVHDWPVQIEWNVSLRTGRGAAPHDTVLVTSPLWTPYSLTALSTEETAHEKVEALLHRKKPRDFFDLYFLIRGRLGIKQVVASKTHLLREVKALNPKTTERELKQFLPRSHWAVVKQLPKLLVQELERL